ncbi:hypothetical protein MKW98_002407, partial [Papaver atlanticum]
YSKCSDQLVNFNKSGILFSKSVDQARQEEVISQLGVQRMKADDKYLGFYSLK